MLIQKLKKILQSKFFLLLLIFITFFYIIICIKNKHYYTKYTINNTKVTGYIQKINIDGNKLTILLKAQEKIIITYYIKDKDKLNLINKYKLGDKLYIKGKFTIPTKNTNFNLFNYRIYLLSQRTYWIVKADNIKKIENNKRIIYKVKNSILDRIRSIKKTKTYLEIFILGDANNLDDKIKNSYQNNGISHIFSISGTHVSIIVCILFLILNKLIKSKTINSFIICIFLLFYMLLIGSSASIMRAVLFFIVIKINKKIEIKTINLFIVFALFMLIINPYNIYNSAFLFSYAISFFLILMSKKITSKNSYIKKIIYISFISFLVSFPIVIYNYYSINLLSIFNNLIFVPFVSIIIFPLSIITFIFPVFDNVLYYFINLMEKLSLFLNNINILKFIMIKPHIILIFIYYLIIYLMLIKSNIIYKIIFILIIIVHLNYNYINSNFYISFLDIGQGDCTLLRFPNNQGSILIDTGGKVEYNNEKWRIRKKQYSIATSTIIPYLKSLGIKKLSYLILTHGDYDHMGETISLVNNFKVEKVIFNCGEFNDLEKELIKVLNKKKIKYYSCIKELNVDNNKLYFLNNKDYGNENDNSIVLYTEINNKKFLFMGDAGIEVEQDLINKYILSDIDILKVGHHGSKTSSSEEFINYVEPKYSVISVGKNNRYGHPNNEVLDILDKSNIYRTDKDGSIMFKFAKNKLKVSTCPP